MRVTFLLAFVQILQHIDHVSITLIHILTLIRQMCSLTYITIIYKGGVMKEKGKSYSQFVSLA